MSTIGIMDVQDIMGGKWKYLIITVLFFSGKLRFLDLKRQVNKIAPKVLSKELKDLEMNNLITRTVCNTKPITVEYELTALGKSLNTVIEAMGNWGINYRKSILKK
jgi:DNA-binding HxlR family transcriptional regulator